MNKRTHKIKATSEEGSHGEKIALVHRVALRCVQLQVVISAWGWEDGSACPSSRIMTESLNLWHLRHSSFFFIFFYFFIFLVDQKVDYCLLSLVGGGELEGGDGRCEEVAEVE